MTESSTSKDRRAQLAAGVGFLFQLAFFMAMLATGLVYQSDAILAIARWMLGGVVIWPVIALVYSQRHRTAEEKREAEELKRSQAAAGSTAIFDTEDEAYLVERRRLAWMLRWLVPGAVLCLAAYHLLGGVFNWSWDFGVALDDQVWRRTQSSGVAMTLVGGVGFLAFLFSRYTVGMARMPGWRMLRSGASYLAGNALACLIVVIAIGLADTELPNPEAIAAYAIRIVFLVLGIEFVANFVLDFYRPRSVMQETRPAFDSRLLALITEPGGIARSLAEAINYQFGFEVSGTWFYQLLKRAALPMLAFGVVTLLLLSCVLIVDVDEEAVVERFGKRLQAEGSALTAGLYLKAPWPVDIAYRDRVHQVRQITVGNAPTEEEGTIIDSAGKKRQRPILWGEKHEFNAEMMLVTASPEQTSFEKETPEDQGKAVSVGLLMVSVVVQYSVDDIHSYLYTFENPESVVEAIAYQVITDYAGGVDVDQFLGPGRTEVNAILLDILQRRVDELSLGIKILFVALQDAHPTDDVAKSFQEVVKAEREKDMQIANARGTAEEILTVTAGSRARALALDEAILSREAIAQQAQPDAEALAAAEASVAGLLLGSDDGTTPPAGGYAAQALAEVQGRVQVELTQAKRKLTIFKAKVAAHAAAPGLFRMREYLTMLGGAIGDIRKYAIVTSPETRVLIEYEKVEEGTLEIGTE